MRQAIIWTYVGPIHWRIYAALGGNEMITYSMTMTSERYTSNYEQTKDTT